MTTNVEFLFDFGSPNAYLSHLVIPRIEARTGVKFKYVPVLLGGVFKATNNVSPAVSLQGIKNKPQYTQLETKRFLKEHDITDYAPNPFFPVNTLAIMRGAVFAQREGFFERYVDAVYRHMWAQPKKMDDPAVIAAALTESGLDADAIFAGTQQPEVKQQLIANVDDAVARGVFGSPSFFVGTELYFGKDRLRDVEEEIERQKKGSKPMSGATELGEVRSERTGHVLTITVDRSGKMNGFTPEMFDALSDAMTVLDEDPDLWAGVLTFAGPHTTAGLDLPRFAAAFSSEGGNAPPDTRIDAFALRRNCRKPVVMAVQGITFTIGIEMMLAADIVIAADDCRFCQMEPKRGLAVFGGAHVRYVERAGWGNAMYHLLRADEFGAARALQIGFVQEVVPAGQQVQRAQAIAAEICTLAPLAVQEIKRGARVYLEQGEQAAFGEIPAMRAATARSKDFAEGLASFREKRAPRFEGR